MVRLIAIPLLLCLTALPVSAQVETNPEPTASGVDPEVAEAQLLFRRGLELGEQGRWADALEHFRRSQSRVPRPSTLFNIGMALVRLGRFVEALDVLDDVLADGEHLPEPARLEAERLREEAARSLAEVEVDVTPPETVLYVDGVVREGLGAARVLPLDPGRHVLRGHADGHEDAEASVSVVAGEHERLALALVPEAVTPPPEAPRPLYEEPWLWIVTGVVVVGVGVGVGVGVAATSGSAPEYGGSTGVVLRAP